jgi:hypothetical protein
LCFSIDQAIYFSTGKAGLGEWTVPASFKQAAREVSGLQDELDFEFPGATSDSRSMAL